MKELAGRLTALDPDAGAAVRVVAYFDQLAEQRAGLEALVRGAAVLAGCPARLLDAERRVRVRVEADGRRSDDDLGPNPAWPCVPLAPGGAPALWLERDGARPSVVDAVILERAANAARMVLDRTRGRAPRSSGDDPASIETVLDPRAPEAARLLAARRLGLRTAHPATRARAVAAFGGEPRILRAASDGGRPADDELPTGRVGVGPAVPVLDLPRSWDAARTALRFTGTGGPQAVDQRVVHAEDLGDLALLAEVVAPGAEPPPDVRAIEAAGADASWMLPTLDAIAWSPSVRAAAAAAHVHHSTLQERLVHAEAVLGWPVRTPRGRLRLQLALITRRLARSVPSSP